jgi:hypothetical protein
MHSFYHFIICSILSDAVYLVRLSTFFYQDLFGIGQALLNEAAYIGKRYTIIALAINLNGPISLDRISPELDF